MVSLIARLRTPGWQRALLLRRSLALVLIGAAIILALPRPSPGQPTVVIFSRDVPAGTTLADQDVAVRRLPAELVPHNALQDITDVVGQVTVAAMTAGEIATPVKFVGQATAQAFDQIGGIAVSELDEPVTLVPLRIASPQVISLLQHGDTVSVVTSEETAAATPRVIASGARVVLPGGEDQEAILLALPASAAEAVAAAALGAPLAVVVTGERAAHP